MPVEIRGAVDLRKALRNFAPDLAKEMNREIAAALKPIVRDARGFVPSSAPMSGWEVRNPTQARFPFFDASAIKRGIGYKTSPSKANARGFRSLAEINNKSAIGAIYETAGRKNPNGQPWVGPGKRKNQKKFSHSNNPEAGAKFIRNLDPLVGSGNDRGRLIYKAWQKNQGKAQDAYFKAVQNAISRFNKRTSIVDVKRAA
jgi:hypothetical protein